MIKLARACLCVAGALLSVAANADDTVKLNIDAGKPGTHRHDAALYEALMQRLSDNGVVAPESFYK